MVIPEKCIKKLIKKLSKIEYNGVTLSRFALIYSLNKNLLWQAVEVFHQCLHLNPNPHSNNCIHLGNSPHRRNNQQHLSLQFPHMALALKVGSMQINDIIMTVLQLKVHFFKIKVLFQKLTI